MLKSIFFILICFGVIDCTAQDTSQDFASMIAERMKDSLLLTDAEHEQIYNINIDISEKKTSAWSEFEGNDSLGIKIQLIENTRDSLYRDVLQEDKFILYQQKKTALVNNN